MFFDSIKKLFVNNKDKHVKCPDCGGQLMYPQTINVHPLLGKYFVKFLMC